MSGEHNSVLLGSLGFLCQTNVYLSLSELRQRQVAQHSTSGPRLQSEVTPVYPGMTPMRPQHGSNIRPGVTPGYPGMTPMRPQQGSNIRSGMTPYGPRGAAQGMQPRNIMNVPQVNGKVPS